MTLSWLANTNQGRMVGDYIATSILLSKAQTVFALAGAPSSTGVFNEAMFAPTGGLTVTGGILAGAAAVVSTSSDHAALTAPPTAH
jgi:hypothetical protein